MIPEVLAQICVTGCLANHEITHWSSWATLHLPTTSWEKGPHYHDVGSWMPII